MTSEIYGGFVHFQFTGCHSWCIQEGPHAKYEKAEKLEADTQKKGGRSE